MIQVSGSQSSTAHPPSSSPSSEEAPASQGKIPLVRDLEEIVSEAATLPVRRSRSRLSRPLVVALIDEIERREGESFADFFHKPKRHITEFFLYQNHSLDTVMLDWMKQPGVLVSYLGTQLVDRKVADRISILTESNDGVTIDLDENTHLPINLTFKWRDPTYRDFNTEMQEFDDYHPIDGVMTPLTLTRFHNGDMTTQIFLKEVHYNVNFPPDLLNPDRPLSKSAKK